MGKGVRGYIRDSIPRELEMHLLKEKCIKKYVENVYQCMKREIQRRSANKKMTREGLQFLWKTAANAASQMTTAFTWKDTPEGFTFWNEVHNRYFIYLESLK